MLHKIEPLVADVSRPELLIRRLEELILEWNAGPGHRLGTKDELCRRFEVSPGTMNQAMRVLETRGVVELRRGWNGGIFVASGSARMIRLSQFVLGLRRNAMTVEEVLSVRNALEPMVIVEATKAVGAGQKSAIVELHRLVDKMEESAADPAEALKWNWLLHRRFAEIGGNTVLTSIYTTLLTFIEQEVAEVAPSDTYANHADVVAMHRELVDAIASGDVAQATRAAARHPLPVDEARREARPAAPPRPFRRGDDR